MRVGILTGGGDCPGLNSVIRAAALMLIHQAHAEVYGYFEGFLGLIENRYRVLHEADVQQLQCIGGTILGTSNCANPFAFFKEDNADVSARVVDNVRAAGLSCVIVIGGDGTMEIAHRLQALGVHIVGIPKTIDNDLWGTDVTFGFDTAVSIAAKAIDRVRTTAESHNRVMIVETMGRYVGWIALYAGVAGAADIILVPEVEYSVAEIARVCKERADAGCRATIIVIAEGAKARGEELSVQMTVKDAPDPIRLGGVANVLALQLRQSGLKNEIRTTILGHIQRGGTPSARDRILCTMFGEYAARLVCRREFGRLVVLHNNSMASIDLLEVAGKLRRVTTADNVFQSAASIGVSFGVPHDDLGLDGVLPRVVPTPAAPLAPPSA